jgi:hypothetical protein
MLKTRCITTILACQWAFFCCSGFLWADDPFEGYFQRKDTVTFSAGNAKEVNSATHVIDPWPRYVRNKRIPGDGERMAGAVQRYRDVSKLKEAPRPIASQITSGSLIQATGQ